MTATRAIASYIASKLQDTLRCEVIDLLQAEQVDLSQYQQVMIGASIRYGTLTRRWINSSSVMPSN